MRRQNVGSSGYAGSWTDDPLWHHGQHSMDIMLWLLNIGKPSMVDVTSVFARPYPETGIPMDISIVVRTSADQLRTAILSYKAQSTSTIMC